MASHSNEEVDDFVSLELQLKLEQGMPINGHTCGEGEREILKQDLDYFSKLESETLEKAMANHYLQLKRVWDQQNSEEVAELGHVARSYAGVIAYLKETYR